MDILDIAYKVLAVVGAIYVLIGMIGLLTCADGDKLPHYMRFLGSGLFLVMFYLLYIRVLKKTIFNINFVMNKLRALGITESTYNECKLLICIISTVLTILVQIYLLYDKKDRILNYLYAKYYPIKTESEKTEFVNSNREELKEMILDDKALKNKRFIEINSNISKLDSIAQKIMCGEYENISVGEINYVLKTQKLNRQKYWVKWLALLIFLNAFIYYFFIRVI